MKIDRRQLLTTTGAAVGAAWLSSRRDAEAASDYVEFEFGGLFALQLWLKTKKKAGFLLTTADEEHMPTLMMPLENWREADSTYHYPQIMHAGGMAFATWSLRNRLVWVADVHTSGGVNTYDSDSAPSLNFPSTKDWERLDNIVDLTKPTKTNPLPVKNKKMVVGKILLTRGEARGAVPELLDERERYYRFQGKKDWHQYAGQVRVSHPVVSKDQTLTLSIAPISSGAFDTPDEVDVLPPPSAPAGTLTTKGFAKIVIDCAKGTPRVSVLNAAAGNGGKMHFRSFFDLVGKTEVKLETTRSNTRATPETPPQRIGMAHESPYIGCVPPGMNQEP